jgi:6-phosphogluconolactonase
MFLDRWGLTNVITLDETDDASSEAASYQTKLEGIPESVLPRDSDGFPIFDLALIGVGDDGHSEWNNAFYIMLLYISRTGPLT